MSHSLSATYPWMLAIEDHLDEALDRVAGLGCENFHCLPDECRDLRRTALVVYSIASEVLSFVQQNHNGDATLLPITQRLTDCIDKSATIYYATDADSDSFLSLLDGICYRNEISPRDVTRADLLGVMKHALRINHEERES